MYENSILNDIKNIDNIVIAGHTNPDGDAIGATFAFAQVMKKLGKNPIILLESVAEKFSYINGAQYLYEGKLEELEPQAFFAIDCGDLNRLGDVESVFKKSRLTYNIDHHISNTNFADKNIVNGSASSASEMVYDLVKDMCDMDVDIATAIYTGIIFDTGGFKHNSTGVHTHQVAAELIGLGVDSSKIHSKVLYEHTIPQVEIFNVALNNLRIDGTLAYSTLSFDEMEKCNTKSGDLDGIVEYLLNIKGIEVSALVSEKARDKVKISLRSNGVDVNYIAGKFGGGGHKQAAGAGYDGSLNDALTDLVAEIKRNL